MTPLEVPDEDWARRSQADLTAITVGRITVAPPWDVPDAAARLSDPGSRMPDPVTDRIVIVIDPSMGFGTGHHQTTRLCLALLQSIADRRTRGRSTSAPARACSPSRRRRSAPRSVTAMDNDPDALHNARENVERNGARRRSSRPELGGVRRRRRPTSSSPTSRPLCCGITRAALRRLVAPDGVLIVSGFSPEELADVTAPFDAREVRTAAEAEWAAAMLACDTRSTDRQDGSLRSAGLDASPDLRRRPGAPRHAIPRAC